MSALTVAALLQFPQLFPHLPSEQFCEMCHTAAQNDRCDIARQYDILEGWGRKQMGEQKVEAERMCAVWYAAWWVRWGQADVQAQRQWADTLADLIGAEAFWRGEVPLPLSMRGY